ncbi:MAG: hypothetical protein WC582_02195 [Patescibacteria group bacterium]
MKGVKIFSQETAASVEKEVNEWLRKNEKIEITHIAQSCSSSGEFYEDHSGNTRSKVIISIFYKKL